MADAPDGRTVFAWHGRSPAEDAARLTDAVAARCVAELFELDGDLVRLEGDRLIPVTKDVLRQVITANFVSVRLVNRGTAEEPKFEREYFSFEFPLAGPDLRKEPNERVLLGMCAALLERVVRGPSTPRALTQGRVKEARDRLAMGEPPQRIAAAYGTSVDVIERLRR